MKKILTALCITICALSMLKADAAVMTTSQVKSVIKNQVLENYKKYTDAQIETEVLALPFKDLVLPEGKVKFTVKLSSDKYMPRDLAKVTVFVDENPVKNFNAPVVTKAYKEVLVASCFINREKPIDSRTVTVKKLEVSYNLDYALTAKDLKEGTMAKKMFNEGEVIDKRFVKSKPDILRNSIVMTVFKTDGLTISTEATALSDGVIGDSICIINKNYNKVYTGKVIGENKVLVKI